MSEKRKKTLREKLEEAGFNVRSTEDDAARVSFLGPKGTAAMREALAREEKPDEERDAAD